jgi:uncharacterized Fe-S cluster protein YjdI/CDGSH-type Zn-finger protein
LGDRENRCIIPSMTEPARPAHPTDAPPPPDARNATRDLTRSYADDRIRVHWYAGRCIHSAECIRAAPRVFDPRKRPWIDLTGADADRIMGAVLRCPTGALEYERLDTGERETPDTPGTVTPVTNGPLYVRGDLHLEGETVGAIRHCTRAALCRCGKSAKMPFCDNSHRVTGFRDT